MRRNSLFALISLIFMSIFIFVLFTDRDFTRTDGVIETETPSEIRFAESELSCLNGVVSVRGKGRLGNQLLEYSSVWSLARLFNMTPSVSHSIFNSLNVALEGLSVPSLPALISTLRNSRQSCENVKEEAVLKIHDQITEDALPAEDVRKKKLLGEPIILRPYIILVPTIARLTEELRKEFRFRKHYRDYAEKKLQEARRALGALSASEEVTFVGVHVRRTDYFSYLRHKFKVGSYADISYFEGAATWLFERLSEDEKALNVLFVVVSDDKTWCEEQLLPALAAMNVTKPSWKIGAVWSGNGDANKPWYDLATLSSCNHSIMTYGTFGIWSSLMAGGYTSVYKLERSKNGAMTFAENLPHWVALR